MTTAAEPRRHPTATRVQGLRRVLVGTDFSLDADRALRRASLLSYAPHATIDLVHVMPEDTAPTVESIVRGAALDRLEAARDKLHELLTDRRRGEIAISVRVLQGEASEALVWFARDREAELICLGRRGLSRLRETLLGNTALRVIRRAGKPVLTVNRVPHLPYRRALVGYDFSADSFRAAAFANRLLVRSGARALVVHAAPEPLEALPPGLSSRADAVAKLERDRILRTRLQTLKGAMRELFRPPESWRPTFDSRDPRRALLAHARERDADLLVLGTAGRRGFGRLMVGSVAEAVLLRAGTDVLIVPRPK